MGVSRPGVTPYTFVYDNKLRDSLGRSLLSAYHRRTSEESRALFETKFPSKRATFLVTPQTFCDGNAYRSSSVTNILTGKCKQQDTFPCADGRVNYVEKVNTSKLLFDVRQLPPPALVAAALVAAGEAAANRWR